MFSLFFPAVLIVQGSIPFSTWVKSIPIMKDAGYLEVIFLNFISDFFLVRSALPINGR
jgi:hypothetical protein